jgi:hypothetical protein
MNNKAAIKNADKIGPWPPVTVRISGLTYYFPFRVFLIPVRKFIAPMVRQEFRYVAENLLLKGGYRRTHFQADQTTLQAVSQIGESFKERIAKFEYNHETFTPLFSFIRENSNPPEVFNFQEIILQTLFRNWLSQKNNLQQLFYLFGIK